MKLRPAPPFRESSRSRSFFSGGSKHLILKNTKKASDTMAGKSSCEFCAYYNYNEYYDDYECSVNLDEDDLARFMSGSDSSCPYFRFSDDYKIVEKQN